MFIYARPRENLMGMSVALWPKNTQIYLRIFLVVERVILSLLQIFAKNVRLVKIKCFHFYI